MDDGFRIGDVVQLKSGGRHMTVVAIRENAEGMTIECVWCETQAMGGEAKTRDCFPPEALDKIERQQRLATLGAFPVEVLWLND